MTGNRLSPAQAGFLAGWLQALLSTTPAAAPASTSGRYTAPLACVALPDNGLLPPAELGAVIPARYGRSPVLPLYQWWEAPWQVIAPATPPHCCIGAGFGSETLRRRRSCRRSTPSAAVASHRATSASTSTSSTGAGGPSIVMHNRCITGSITDAYILHPVHRSSREPCALERHSQLPISEQGCVCDTAVTRPCVLGCAAT